ncbi:ECF transporter S component [Thermohalobacter berrensis]|uniref:ECF transporter S component n=1 Tax=Thermohalobacter berrensis TaxID=99594 RepID=A0A419T3N0_9FIRM|nr:ECF transporter S component [Thermohalobacter berrensis]RKD32082.1 ECF transporter S component [Thermohalobacter berrensis]
MKRNSTATYLVRTAILLALALVFQIGFRAFAQPLVGPLVNMVLILSAALVGTVSGVLVGCFTPLIAFAFGIMPLFPLVPFIMIGNSLLVIVFNAIRTRVSNYGDYVGIVVAAFVKFVFLAFSVRQLLSLFIPKVPPKIIAAFSLPQLFTALIGGIVALIVIKFLPEDMYIKNN